MVLDFIQKLLIERKGAEKDLTLLVGDGPARGAAVRPSDLDREGSACGVGEDEGGEFSVHAPIVADRAPEVDSLFEAVAGGAAGGVEGPGKGGEHGADRAAGGVEGLGDAGAVRVGLVGAEAGRPVIGPGRDVPGGAVAGRVGAKAEDEEGVGAEAGRGRAGESDAPLAGRRRRRSWREPRASRTRR